MCLSQKISHNKRWIFFNLWNYLHLCRHLLTLSVTFDTTTSLYLRKEFFPPDNCSLSACTCFKEECVCACVRVKVRERAWYGSGCVCESACSTHIYFDNDDECKWPEVPSSLFSPNVHLKQISLHSVVTNVTNVIVVTICDVFLDSVFLSHPTLSVVRWNSICQIVETNSHFHTSNSCFVLKFIICDSTTTTKNSYIFLQFNYEDIVVTKRLEPTTSTKIPVDSM